MLSVVLPTISGREESLARTIASYETTLDGTEHELIVVKDESSWPRACNVGYQQSKGDVIHWGADDLEATPGWYDDIPAFLERDEIPAPAVYDYRLDGRFANAEDGQDGDTTWFTRVPLCRRDQAERIGLWPEITYYADVWFSEKARAVGIETRLVWSYRFVHHWSPIGRVDSQRNLTEAWAELATLRQGLTEGGVMARKRTTPAKKTAAKKPAPELVHEEGFWWIVSGTKRVNVGRNQKYAQRLLDEGILSK